LTFYKFSKSILSLKIIKAKLIIINLTSYDNIWAITRIDPMIEYIELKDHPIKKNIYPIKVKMIIIINKKWFIK